MRRIVHFILVATLASGIFALSATAAQANATPNCITRAEFRRIHQGQSVTRVAQIVGYRGQISLSSPPMIIRDFRTCTAYHVSNVTYWSGRVDGKLYI